MGRRFPSNKVLTSSEMLDLFYTREQQLREIVHFFVESKLKLDKEQGYAYYIYLYIYVVGDVWILFTFVM